MNCLKLLAFAALSILVAYIMAANLDPNPICTQRQYLSKEKSNGALEVCK